MDTLQEQTKSFQSSKKKTGCLIASLILLISIIMIVGVETCADSSSDKDKTEQNANETNPKFERFAYYKRDKKGDFNYRIFVYITDASSKDMEKHAKKQQWSSHGTTMVCYFRNTDGLNSDAITLAKNVDAAINEIWKPNLVARYIHWPTGKEQFEENPYAEDTLTSATEKQSTSAQNSNTRCIAKTEDGTRCLRNTDNNSIYCWQHKK